MKFVELLNRYIVASGVLRRPNDSTIQRFNNVTI